MKSVKLLLQYGRAIPGCFVFLFVLVYTDHRFFNTWWVFILKISHFRWTLFATFSTFLFISTYVLYSFNSSCKKLVKEYFPFKSENKFIFIKFINTHQSFYFKSFYPKSVKIILFKIRIMSYFKDFPLNMYRPVRHVTGNDQDYLRKIPRVVVQKSALL